MMNFIMILDAILCVVMAGFTGWNWMLALNGKTTIEFWTNFDKDKKLIELSFPNASDNLYRVFGTYKPFRVLSPSLRNVPFTGLEWSFWFKDSGYDANGYAFPKTMSDQESGRAALSQTGSEKDFDYDVELVLIQ